jgi:hypothetical protein
MFNSPEGRTGSVPGGLAAKLHLVKTRFEIQGFEIVEGELPPAGRY